MKNYYGSIGNAIRKILAGGKQVRCRRTGKWYPINETVPYFKGGRIAKENIVYSDPHNTNWPAKGPGWWQPKRSD